MREIGRLETLENMIIKQGLDLKGGIYIVLEVDLPTLVTTSVSYTHLTLPTILLV